MRDSKERAAIRSDSERILKWAAELQPIKEQFNQDIDNLDSTFRKQEDFALFELNNSKELIAQAQEGVVRAQKAKAQVQNDIARANEDILRAQQALRSANEAAIRVRLEETDAQDDLHQAEEVVLQLEREQDTRRRDYEARKKDIEDSYDEQSGVVRDKYMSPVCP